MADLTFPAPTEQTSWLDRPAIPTWLRVSTLIAHWEVIAYVTLIVVGLLLRMWDLSGRAMHHDESLHAYYSWRLYDGQGYTYDPLMHGPFQFEVVPVFYMLFGSSQFSARLLAVLLGTVLIVLPYFLRPYIGRAGALFAGVMLCVSPAFVYFSRFIRDDIYLACFTLVLFIAIVRYLDEQRPIYLQLAAGAMALAMGSMEAAYITFFIFGTFLIFEGVRERLGGIEGPVLAALRATSLDTWLTSAAIFIVLVVLMFSTFFSNPYGIWDTQHPLCLSNCISLHPAWNPDRKDILGGLTYWLVQHSVQRGGQPWFYYLLVLPLYEQLAVLFGLAGLAYAAMRRSLVPTFLAWWAVLSLLLYSWAGEKMPWLSIHIALPFIMLGAWYLSRIWTSGKRRIVLASGVAFVSLLALEIHSTFLLNYVDAANPTEMLIYVQTSQDVPKVVGEIGQIAHKQGTGAAMPVGLDDADVGGWPFTWYLRNYTRVTETSVFSGTVCGGQYCPVLLLLQPEFDKYSSQLMPRYVVQRYRWNWWFPEDYKQWFPQHWDDALHGRGSLLGALLGSSTDRQHVWDWLMYRRSFGDRGARWLYFLVRRDLVPNGKQYSTTAPGVVSPIVPRGPALASHVEQTFGLAGGGAGALAGPRGIATAPDGDTFVADTLNHRIVVFGPNGRVVRVWGSVGSAAGQFSANNSPLSLTIGPNGLVYVADTWNQRIQVFTRSGRFVNQWGSGVISTAAGGFFGPRSIAVSTSGRVYVADTGNKRIEVFSAKGKYISSWGTAGTAPGQFMEPSSVAIAPDGTVYVADFWNQRIQAFGPSGLYLRSWQVPDWTSGSYDEPYLAVAPRTGNVIASDPQQRQVLVYTRNGHLVGSFGSAQLSLPIGVAVKPNGSLTVSDTTANRVQVFKVSASPNPISNGAAVNLQSNQSQPKRP